MQPYVDWELIEAKRFDDYQYTILKVTDTEGRTILKGWAYGTSGTTWLEDESLDNLRSALITSARQLI